MCELNDQDRQGGMIKEEDREGRGGKQDSGTGEIGAGRVLKSSFVLVSAGTKTGDYFGWEKFLYCLE